MSRRGSAKSSNQADVVEPSADRISGRLIGKVSHIVARIGLNCQFHAFSSILLAKIKVILEHSLIVQGIQVIVVLAVQIHRLKIHRVGLHHLCELDVLSLHHFYIL